MFILQSGSIGLLCLLIVACSQPQTTSHQISQPVPAAVKTTISAGLSDANATPETRALYTHLQNIKFASSPERSHIELTRFAQDYLYAYRDDEYVDIMGLDNYWI